MKKYLITEEQFTVIAKAVAVIPTHQGTDAWNTLRNIETECAYKEEPKKEKK